jgi:hypothetical protein
MKARLLYWRLLTLARNKSLFARWNGVRESGKLPGLMCWTVARLG